MEKLSKQTFELLRFINNRKPCHTLTVLSDFKGDTRVIRKRLDELFKLGLIRKQGETLLIVAPIGRKLIADAAGNKQEILKNRFSDFKFNIASGVIGGLVVLLIEKAIGN